MGKVYETNQAVREILEIFNLKAAEVQSMHLSFGMDNLVELRVIGYVGKGEVELLAKVMSKYKVELTLIEKANVPD